MAATPQEQLRAIEEEYILLQEKEQEKFGFLWKLNLAPGIRSLLEENGWHCYHMGGNVYALDCIYSPKTSDPEEQFIDILRHAIREHCQHFEYIVPDLFEETRMLLSMIGILTHNTQKKDTYFFSIIV